MLFNSIEFLIFFPFVALLYFLSPHSKRWIVLLAASCYFYMAFVPVYILILSFTILIDYFVGRYLEVVEGKRRKQLLVASLFANLGVLFAFKYFEFFSENVNLALQFIGLTQWIPTFKILLPIGLSFHTFQSLSYIIEVYLGRQKAEKHLGYYALYVMFFPQLVAGPIERPQHLLHQLHEKHKPNLDRTIEGLKLIVWGFFKKIVVADRLALFVDEIYGAPQSFSGAPLIIATYFFAFQIYCDFSGYSDIAIGSARILGIDLMQNFRTPYFSKSIAEFWRRWHISLSTWFRDYLYIPLGGNRGSTFMWCRNLLIVFILSGIWHGANWTFAVWGLLHGMFLVCAVGSKRVLSRVRENLYVPSLPGFVKILITFHIVLLSWIFFRANSISDACYVLYHLFSPTIWGWHGVMGHYQMSTGFVLIALLVFLEWIYDRDFLNKVVRRFWFLRLDFAYYALLLVIILAGGVFDGS
ncbi:MAG: MBOAT family protein, partial [Bdellovibrionales bacterium]|nr:MBOAT family protein [Bdellovibrionales bacterium]